MAYFSRITTAATRKAAHGDLPNRSWWRPRAKQIGSGELVHHELWGTMLGTSLRYGERFECHRGGDPPKFNVTNQEETTVLLTVWKRIHGEDSQEAVNTRGTEREASFHSGYVVEGDVLS